MRTALRRVGRVFVRLVGRQPRPGDPDLARVRREQAEIRARLLALEVQSDWRGDRRGAGR